MKTFFITTFLILYNSCAYSSCIKNFKLLAYEAHESLMESGMVKIIGPLETDSRHATEVYTAIIDEHTMAIFKPNMKDVNASNSGHEVAAYLLSKELNLDFVPITVERFVDGRLGSLQLMVKESETATKKAGHFFYADYVTKLRSNKLNFFDYLTVNFDRHSDNFIFDKWGKLWAIDHGAGFMLNTYDFRKIDRLFGGGMESLRVSAEIISKLNDLSDVRIRDLFSNYLNERDLINLMGRRNAYLERFLN